MNRKHPVEPEGVHQQQDSGDVPPFDVRREAGPGHSSGFGDRQARYETINRAYRLFDEYMRQGQRLAEDFWLPRTAEGDRTPPFEQVLDRLVRSASQIGTGWFQLMMNQANSAQRNPQRGAGPFTAGRGVARADEVPQSESGLGGLSLRLEAARPVQVSVNIQPGFDPRHLVSGELTADEPMLGRISGIELHVDAHNHLLFCLVVPESQAPGVYNGVLRDRHTQRQYGTVTVRLD